MDIVHPQFFFQTESYRPAASEGWKDYKIIRDGGCPSGL